MKKLILKLLPFDDLLDTIKRFPLSIICTIALFIIGIAITHDIIDDKPEWIGQLSVILGCCYFWFGISKLISESHDFGADKYAVISFVGAAAITALFVLSSFWEINLFFVLPALLLCIMVAPYFRKSNDLSVWFFNQNIWLGVVISYAALLLFAGGLSIALMAIHTLFDIHINHKIYSDIWLFSALILGPVYALSWVPKKFEYSDDDCNAPHGLKFIVNWVSSPMIFIYLLILYAYFGKIVITGEVPNGHLAYMISVFIGAGIVTYLVAHPLRNEGSAQLRLFYKIFFPALIMPIGFHFYAIWERVSAYGFTEQRYMLMLSAVWFAIITIGGIYKKMPIKFIPMSLAILLALASFGPWGGVSVSGNSQFARLEKLLVKNNLLENGKVIKAKTDLSFDDRSNISSILDYLCKSYRDGMVEQWFNTKNTKNWDCYGGSNLTKHLGFDYINKYEARKHNDSNFYLNLKTSEYRDISLYDIMIDSIYLNPVHGDDENIKEWKRDWLLENQASINMKFSKGILKVKIDEYKIIEININDYADKKRHMMQNKEDLIISAENQDVSYRLYIKSLSGKIIDNAADVSYLSFDFLYRIKD